MFECFDELFFDISLGEGKFGFGMKGFLECKYDFFWFLECIDIILDKILMLDNVTPL